MVVKHSRRAQPKTEGMTHERRFKSHSVDRAHSGTIMERRRCRLVGAAGATARATLARDARVSRGQGRHGKVTNKILATGCGHAAASNSFDGRFL